MVIDAANYYSLADTTCAICAICAAPNKLTNQPTTQAGAGSKAVWPLALSSLQAADRSGAGGDSSSCSGGTAVRAHGARSQWRSLCCIHCHERRLGRGSIQHWAPGGAPGARPAPCTASAVHRCHTLASILRLYW
jgi:hypothetical protein